MILLHSSMEAHHVLTSSPQPVPCISFGTGSLVRLPGPSVEEPNIYHFNTVTYDAIYKELATKNLRLYTANGLLTMLDRNRHVKRYPERWQDWKIGVPRLTHTADRGSRGCEAGVVDVVITCESRCWDNVVEDLLSRGAPLNRPVHIFNIDIKDNHEEALVGGRAILDLATRLNQAAKEERGAKGTEGWEEGRGGARMGFDERVPEILAEWQERWPNLPALWTLAWF